MPQNSITLKNVEALRGMTFLIPDYQRGYRWTSQQVNDLLNDLLDFKKLIDTNPESNNFYCLQPLVVKKLEEDILENIKTKAHNLADVEKFLKGSWEVIDGQQRLTTIYIILGCLGIKDSFVLNYVTREESAEFLKTLIDNKAAPDSAQEESKSKERNIDYYHFNRTKQTVEAWMGKHPEIDPIEFSRLILSRLKFIWYESVNENPIKVFTRLNIGKIALTNAELIKALLLKADNFKGNLLEQYKLALDWDSIEHALQDDEFWLFLNDANYHQPTRIDMILEIIHRKNLLEVVIDKDAKERIGNDRDAVFRYFYEYFQQKNDIRECGELLRKIFNIFMEWFNDRELYHYVGFLIAVKNNPQEVKTDMLLKWTKSGNDKEKFRQILIEDIKKVVKNQKDLTAQYETNGVKKTVCLPLLLLHNVQTVINESKQNLSEYGAGTFYKFPFHLFKLEDWHVEHIDSNTVNELKSRKDKLDWLKFSLLDEDINSNAELKDRILKYIDKEEGDFDSLRHDIETLTSSADPAKTLTADEKNRIWNFSLLDASTNTSYGNSIFPAKRRVLIGKDQGKKYDIEIKREDPSKKDSPLVFEINDKLESDSSFIPPCTKYAFLKYYNVASASIKYWDRIDATAYRNNIFRTLEMFDVEIPSAEPDSKDEGSQPLSVMPN